MNSAEKVAGLLLRIKAVEIKPLRPFRYASGMLSPIYTDNRLLMSYPGVRDLVIRQMVSLARKKRLSFDVVAGTATAGIPHAAWLADKLRKPMVYIRSGKKTHGKGKQVEGKLEKGNRVLLVEDLVTTGASSLDAVGALRRAGAKVVSVIAIFTYGLPAAKRAFARKKVKLQALTDFKTLIRVSEKLGYVDPAERKTALAWQKNPKQWGKVMGFE